MTLALASRSRVDRPMTPCDFASRDSRQSWMILGRCGQGGHLVRGPHAAPAAPFPHRGGSRREAALCPQDDDSASRAVAAVTGEARHGVPLAEALRRFVPVELAERVDAADERRAAMRGKGLDITDGAYAGQPTHQREQRDAHRLRNAAFRARCLAGELIVSWCDVGAWTWTEWPPEAWGDPDTLRLLTVEGAPVIHHHRGRPSRSYSKVRVRVRTDAAQVVAGPPVVPVEEPPTSKKKATRSLDHWDVPQLERMHSLIADGSCRNPTQAAARVVRDHGHKGASETADINRLRDKYTRNHSE